MTNEDKELNKMYAEMAADYNRPLPTPTEAMKIINSHINKLANYAKQHGLQLTHEELSIFEDAKSVIGDAITPKPHPGHTCVSCQHYKGSDYGSEFCSKWEKWDGVTERKINKNANQRFSSC